MEIIKLYDNGFNLLEFELLERDVELGDTYYSGGNTISSLHICDSERLKEICKQYKAKPVRKYE